jgi:transposase-like protein
MFERKRTSVELVMYALYLYFLGLSFRNTSKALEPFEEKRSHVSVWNWVQRFNNPKKIYPRKRRVTVFIIDETMIQTEVVVAMHGYGLQLNPFIAQF